MISIDTIKTTPDPGYQWEGDKLTVRHHKQEPRGQPSQQEVICVISSLPAI